MFRPNLQNEDHRRAWALLQAVPDGQKSAFLVKAILDSARQDALESTLRRILREELQAVGSGKSMARMGLKQMMRAVKGGLAQAVLVQDLTRLSHDPAILMKILEFLQDHDAALITTESDLQYELYIKGLEQHFLRRAAQTGLRLPW